jgi:CBS domain-containing protein
MSDEKEGVQKEDCLPLKIQDIMIRDVVTLDENATVKMAAEIMNRFEIGSLIIVDGGKAVGIVTERDLLKRVIAETRDANTTKIKEIMTTPLIVAEPNTDLEKAVRQMFQLKIKKLPVVDGKRLVGLVSMTDIARFHPAMMKQLKQLAVKQAAPKSIKKVIDYYVV